MSEAERVQMMILDAVGELLVEKYGLERELAAYMSISIYETFINVVHSVDREVFE